MAWRIPAMSAPRGQQNAQIPYNALYGMWLDPFAE